MRTPRRLPPRSGPGRLIGAMLAALVVLAPPTECAAAEPPPEKTGAAGTVRFASLKSDRVNLRAGPGTEYPTVWVYRRAGLPLEIIKEFEGWRQVRDADGATGWVLQYFLSGRRTALVMPWEAKAGSLPPQVDLYGDDSERSRVVARVEAGVIANIASCDGRWCRITIDDYKGYMPQKRLWGVYEGEIVK